MISMTCLTGEPAVPAGTGAALRACPAVAAAADVTAVTAATTGTSPAARSLERLTRQLSPREVAVTLVTYEPIVNVIDQVCAERAARRDTQPGIPEVCLSPGGAGRWRKSAPCWTAPSGARAACWSFPARRGRVRR